MGSGTSDLVLAPADQTHALAAVNIWFPYHANKSLTDPNWKWRWFEWGKIIRNTCYKAVAAVAPNGWLEGLMAYNVLTDCVKVEFLATAPWNYGKGKMRAGVGPALLSNAIGISAAAGLGGMLRLSSIPEAETFYESRRFTRTGHVDHENLPIFELPGGQTALAFVNRYPAIP